MLILFQGLPALGTAPSFYSSNLIADIALFISSCIIFTGKIMAQTVNLALQILPSGNSVDAYALVDKAIEVIRRSGLPYQVCPFETVLEGDYDAVMKVAREAQEACFEAGADDMMVFIKIQRSKNRDATIQDKMHKYS